MDMVVLSESKSKFPSATCCIRSWIRVESKKVFGLRVNVRIVTCHSNVLHLLNAVVYSGYKILHKASAVVAVLTILFLK